MNTKERVMRLIGKSCFGFGLLIELMMMVLETSSYIIQHQTFWFRLAFLLFGVKIVLTSYSKKEYGVILFFGIIGILSYLGSGREEVIRIVAFCIALKDLDYRKILKITFYSTLTGMFILIILSLFGIMGKISMTEVYRNGIEETRYVLGMGHPNALHCMVWVLTTLGIFLYFTSIKWYHLISFMIINILCYMLTVSRTGFLVTTVTIIVTTFFVYASKQRNKKWVYILGIMALTACIVLAIGVSLYGVGWNRGLWNSALVDKIDFSIFSARFRYAYYRADLSTWHLFGDTANDRYFDMGIVRLFYWYGIIPGLLYMVLQMFLLKYSYKKKEYGIYIIVTMFAFYHIWEAHAISVFIARNYILFIIGGVFSEMFNLQDKEEIYFWNMPQLMFKNGVNSDAKRD